MNPAPPQLAPAIELMRRGAYPQAISLLQQAVAAQPGHFEARLQLAKACLDWVHIQAGMPLSDIEPEKLSGEAAHYLMLAEAQLNVLAPRHAASPHVQGMLAVAHIIHGRYAEAERSLKKALAKDPRNPDLLFNLGHALMRQDRHAEAASLFARLTGLYPGEAGYWQELGEARRLGGKPEEALPHYRRALRLSPDWALPHGGLATALRELDRSDEALAVLLDAVTRIADSQDLNFLLATTALSVGQWGTGWRYYACRPSGESRVPFPEKPAPCGRLLRVRYDQGLGDQLFFLRFAPVLVARGTLLDYTSHPRLLPLLRDQPGLAKLEADTPAGAASHDCLLSDLPYVAGMRDASDIPPSLRLPLDAPRVDALREQLIAFGPPPYLGITWEAGSAKPPGRRMPWRSLHKEISPQLLGRLARDWPGTVVVLQRLPKPEDLASFSAALGRPYLDWSRLNDDLQDALAGLSLLDEYVGVSNTNMHLMAGLGKTARVLVPHPADWRWMAEGEESPWFPGFKVYRQDKSGDWSAALQALTGALKAQWG